MAHSVICVYCNTKFDRDKEEYAQVKSRRYAHAACMLREAAINPALKVEIIDPNDEVTCVYCKKTMSKKNTPDCIQVDNGKYAHKGCQELEDKREKTDLEKLEAYIKQLFGTSYINPRVRKQINQYVNEFNYTYSGIHKALQYFYEIKGHDIEKANGSIGIVPHIYQDAYNYHYNLWLAKQKNKDIRIQLYEPKVKEIVIPRPQRNIKKRPLFTFLDEEEE